MIISPARNFIFVHIPKTGGTSLALALEARAHKDDILIGDTPKAKKRKGRLKGAETRGRLWKHSTLADIEGLVTPTFIRGAFTVTLVRNPWDRVVSLYHWLRDQTFDHPSVARAKALPFEGFIKADETQAALQANPYAHYMELSDGTEHVRLYIRLEHFVEDAGPLWDHLGFELSLPHENRSIRAQDYRAYYDADSREQVARACAADVRRFEYHF